MQDPTRVAIEDCNIEDSINNSLYNISEKDFRVEMLRLLNKLKETKELSANKKEKNKNRNDKTTNRHVKTEKYRNWNEWHWSVSSAESELLRTESVREMMKCRNPSGNKRIWETDSNCLEENFEMNLRGIT